MLLLLFPINAVAAEGFIKEPEKNFVFEGDRAEDRKTGLIWKRCAVGMDWDAAKKTCAGQPKSLNQQTAKEAAAVAGQGWRVPTGEELETLLVSTCDGPKINTVAFPSTESSDFGEGAKFWTSTEAMPGMFYYFDFANGWADMHSAGYGLSVLLVKTR
jgi:hypothetical protein